MEYTEQYLEKLSLVDSYINFSAICEDFDLDEGGLAPEQLMDLERILIEFIQQNKWDQE
jgi:hypothetical protein